MERLKADNKAFADKFAADEDKYRQDQQLWQQRIVLGLPNHVQPPPPPAPTLLLTIQRQGAISSAPQSNLRHSASRDRTDDRFLATRPQPTTQPTIPPYNPPPMIPPYVAPSVSCSHRNHLKYGFRRPPKHEPHRISRK